MKYVCLITLVCVMSTCELVSLVAQMVKHLLAMWESRVQSLCREDPLEKEMASHTSTLAWKSLPRERPVCHGTFEVASRVPSTVSHFKTERGNSLEML